MTNISLSIKLVENLVAQGLRNFVVCAGARNAPLIKVLENVRDIEVEEYFEERAAAFYAMGLAKASGRPAAVVTTSGTAVANLYPAIMESSYSGVPLVAITADRPASYRGSGAPQAVYQPGLFGDHVQESYDVSTNEHEHIQLYCDSPVHINVCYDEPLLDEDLSSQKFELKSPDLPSAFAMDNFSLPADPESFQRPLVILGSLPSRQRDFVKSCLMELGATIYAEAHSGLREDSELSPYLVKAGELAFGPDHFNKNFDSVIRIGGTPSCRLWRDLESKLASIPVASFSSLPYSGLSRSAQIAPLEELPGFLEQLDILPSEFSDEELRMQLQEAKKSFPRSEVALLQQWAQSAPGDANILLGNSLPIREWELAMGFQSKDFHIYSNRGVNGIDGLIATACGLAKATGKRTYVVLGDLSALYDLSSLALVSKMKSLVRPVIVNNGGGMIFRRIFNDEKFENRHSWDFSEAGKMFGLSYGDDINDLPDILEIKPDADESAKFWRLYLGEGS